PPTRLIDHPAGGHHKLAPRKVGLQGRIDGIRLSKAMRFKTEEPEVRYSKFTSHPAFRTPACAILTRHRDPPGMQRQEIPTSSHRRSVPPTSPRALGPG